MHSVVKVVAVFFGVEGLWTRLEFYDFMQSRHILGVKIS